MTNSDESLLRQPAGAGLGEARAREIVKASQGQNRSLAHMNTHHNIREEAAALFAAGENRSAIETLLNELNAKSGKAEKPIWYLLLDIYQAQNQQNSYERLAEYFATYFRTSPPAWEVFEDNLVQEGVGRNALVIDGAPSIVSEEKMRDFVKASKKAGSCRLDLSRLRLDEKDEGLMSGLSRLRSTMAVLRQSRVRAILMGETGLVQKINHDIEANLLEDLSNEPFWLFLLECLQWRGEEDRFEDLALRFAIHFEISPPGFEKEGAIANHPSTQKKELLDFKLPDLVDVRDLESILSNIDAQLGEKGSVELNLRPVRRMTFEAATQLADFLKNLNISPSRVNMKNATEILSALFDITGISSLVSVSAKKR